jgi:hypothetical protein
MEESPQMSPQPADQAPDQSTPDARAPFLNRLAGQHGPRRVVVLSLTAAALVATGGVALAAAGASPSPGVTSNSAAGPNGAARMPGQGRFGMPVHGEFVVPDGKGGYQTEVMQRGTITAVSAGHLSVKSADNYTHDYVTDSNTMFGRGRMGRMHQMGARPNGMTGNGMTGNGMGSVATPNSTPANPPAATSASPTSGANLTVGQSVMVIAVHDGNGDRALRVTPAGGMGATGKGGGMGMGGMRGHRGPGGFMGGGQFPGGSGGGPNRGMPAQANTGGATATPGAPGNAPQFAPQSIPQTSPGDMSQSAPQTSPSNSDSSSNSSTNSTDSGVAAPVTNG